MRLQLSFVGFLAAVVGSAAGCAGTVAVGAPRPTVVVAEERESRPALGVPPGHLPPPGACRVWYPGRPPGHQPPPVRCANAASRAPAGTWVLYRPTEERRVVHARVIDPRRAGVVVEVRVYDAERGRYLRTERQ